MSLSPGDTPGEAPDPGWVLPGHRLSPEARRAFAERACPERRSPRARRRRTPTYGLAVIEALRTIWEAAGYPWSVRLKALLPLWLPRARRRLPLSPAPSSVNSSPSAPARSIAAWRPTSGSSKSWRVVDFVCPSFGGCTPRAATGNLRKVLERSLVVRWRSRNRPHPCPGRSEATTMFQNPHVRFRKHAGGAGLPVPELRRWAGIGGTRTAPRGRSARHTGRFEEETDRQSAGPGL